MSRGILPSIQNAFNYYSDRLLVLKHLVKEPQPVPEEIFPFLTPLVENPKTLYKPLFEKIKQLGIHPEVTKKAQEGLDRFADEREIA